MPAGAPAVVQVTSTPSPEMAAVSCAASAAQLLDIQGRSLAEATGQDESGTVVRQVPDPCGEQLDACSLTCRVAPRVLLPLGALDTARLCLGESEAPPARREA